MTTNLAAFNSTHSLAHGPAGQKPSTVWLSSMLSVSKAKIKVSAESLSGGSGENLLAINQGLLSAPRGHIPYHVVPPSSSQQWHIQSFMSFESLTSSFCSSSPPLLPLLLHLLPLLLLHPPLLLLLSLLPPAKENSAFKGLL